MVNSLKTENWLLLSSKQLTGNSEQIKKSTIIPSPSPKDNGQELSEEFSLNVEKTQTYNHT